ncbi:hypothetical protein OSTOST_24426, partial [Ostertagia ostertagi]
TFPIRGGQVGFAAIGFTLRTVPGSSQLLYPSHDMSVRLNWKYLGKRRREGPATIMRMQRFLPEMNRFITTLTSAYDISQQNVRVGIIAVGSDEKGAATVANFKAIDSYGALVYYINFVKEEYADFKHDGQALEEAFSIAALREFKDSGYRTNLKNHVIVYVTATT